MIEKLISLESMGPEWGSVYTHIHSRTMEKVAASYIPEGLMQLIETIKPRPEGRYVLINALGAYEVWGCFTADTPILMSTGKTRPIANVAPGDSVITHSGRARQVLNVQITQNKFKKRRIFVEGLDESIETTPEHPFLACSEVVSCAVDKYKRCVPGVQGKARTCQKQSALKTDCGTKQLSYPTTWVAAGELTVGDWVIYQLPPARTKAVLSLSLARLIGLFLAEGNYQKYRKGDHAGKAHSLEFSFGLHEEPTLVAEVRQLAEFLGWSARVYRNEKRSHISVRVRCGRRIGAWIRKQFGEYSYGKRIPMWLISEPLDVRVAVLGGYIDGDGCYNVRGTHNACVARTASKDLAEGLQRLIWSCGSPARVISGNWSVKRTHYQISFALSKLPLLAQHSSRYKVRELKQTTKVRSFVYQNKVYLPIRKIEDYETDALVYNLEVADDHTFIAGGVTVHNCNANADAFPEWSLKSLPPPKDVVTLIDSKVKERIPDFTTPSIGTYGAPTFTSTAKVYLNHINKDPLIACGDVIAQAYNDRMHRVELILFVYKDRAPEVVELIDAGAPVPWSMGARLKFDVCSICSNIAKSRSEYCTHLSTQLRQVLPDGRKVFSYNYFPVFFDISKVTVPADKSAWMLRKVASAAPVYKQAVLEKREIVKETPSNLGTAPIDPKLLSFIQSKAPAVLSDEYSLPDPQLRELSKNFGVAELLKNMLMLGILPTAREIDVVSDKNPGNIPDRLDLVNPNRKLIMILGSSVPDRSLLDPHFSKRACRVTKTPPLVKSACGRKFAEVLSRVDFVKLTNMIDTNPTIRLTVDSTALESSFIKSAGSRELVWLPFVVCSHFLRSNYLC